jgi:hypothetical protein
MLILKRVFGTKSTARFATSPFLRDRYGLLLVEFKTIGNDMSASVD